eukprot:CAMPEP_0196769262 /NCGR_PEP_ID=MMETSP1104-20130614/430_1 /TAXON_ID=33652 /ORGANISM="Cafeteria sp., Strain Caron Lab Isolate" /LENGTH=211 /DNA_ID=CAMNT_0042139347 /DNA_START=59 /DNA_END=694 /DNA_ORIENTATION=-
MSDSGAAQAVSATESAAATAAATTASSAPAAGAADAPAASAAAPAAAPADATAGDASAASGEAQVTVLPENTLPYTEQVKDYIAKLATAPVIDWDAAIKQVGEEDRNFLFELLHDLYKEGTAHVNEVVMAVQAMDIKRIQHHSHAVKGAAANIMCFRLRWAAAALEQSCKDHMNGIVSLEHLRHMLYYRVPAFHQEFVHYINMLKANQLLK